MGGCASRPKGFRAEVEKTAAPEPAPAKEGPCTASEAKTEGEVKEIEAAVKVNEEAAKTGGLAEEGKVKGENVEVDEHGNKRRSLSTLFKENEEESESTGSSETTQTENVPLDTVLKEKEDPKTEETITNVLEAEKAKSPVKEDTAAIVITSETVQTEKPTESVLVVETVSTDEKKKEKEVATKDAKVTETASADDIKGEQPVSLESSVKVVAGEVAETK